MMFCCLAIKPERSQKTKVQPENQSVFSQRRNNRPKWLDAGGGTARSRKAKQAGKQACKVGAFGPRRRLSRAPAAPGMIPGLNPPLNAGAGLRVFLLLQLVT
jgi:hypothetical protein